MLSQSAIRQRSLGRWTLFVLLLVFLVLVFLQTCLPAQLSAYPAAQSLLSGAETMSIPEFKTGSVQANGLEFHYLEMGEGPLVLAIHGFPDHARSFRHQMPALAEAGYRVVAPFTRGYAPTSVPKEAAYGTPKQAQDIVALIEALGAESVILIGHDWGAAAAYAAAVLAPEKIEKLVTIAVPYGNGFGQALVANAAQQKRSWYMFFFQMGFAEAAVAHDNYAFLDRLWQDWSPGWDAPPEEMAALKDTYKKPGVLEAALKYYRHAFNPSPEVAQALASVGVTPGAKIEVPSLYLHGENDGCIGWELAEGMEEFFPKGLEAVLLKDVGHFLHQEDPETVNRLILEFLDR